MLLLWQLLPVLGGLLTLTFLKDRSAGRAAVEVIGPVTVRWLRFYLDAHARTSLVTGSISLMPEADAARVNLATDLLFAGWRIRRMGLTFLMGGAHASEASTETVVLVCDGCPL